MNLNHLNYFRVLAKLEHYTQAAEELSITQPSLSHAMASLEKDLGTYLFEKQGRNIKLTKYGKIYFEYVDRALSELEKGEKKLEELGFVKNLIEISNDEVKREALKFEAVSIIEFIDSENNLQELIIQPSSSPRPKIKTKILAVAHSMSPKTFVEKLVEIDNSVKIHNELFELISAISKIQNPRQIMFLVKDIVKNARSESFKKHRDVIQKIIDTHVVDNMIQLLTLFKKLELVTENDIEASEYVRYIIYQSLIERKKQSL